MLFILVKIYRVEMFGRPVKNWFSSLAAVKIVVHAIILRKCKEKEEEEEEGIDS